jgi:hypothetical protein
MTSPFDVVDVVSHDESSHGLTRFFALVSVCAQEVGKLVAVIGDEVRRAVKLH